MKLFELEPKNQEKIIRAYLKAKESSASSHEIQNAVDTLEDIADDEIDQRDNLIRTKAGEDSILAGFVQNNRKMDQDNEDPAAEYRFDPKGRGYRNIFNRYLLYGDRGLSSDEHIRLQNRKEEIRAGLQSDMDSAGGYLTNQQLARNIINDFNQSIAIRELATKIELPNATSLGVPAVDSDMGDLTWTSELSTGSEDTDLDFGKRELRPYPLARRIRVSRKLLRTAAISPEQIVRSRFSYKMGTVQENAFLNGKGVNQPLGVFTVSDHGITADRDVSTGATTTSITYDHLVNCVAALTNEARKNATWLVSRDFLARLQKIKSGEGMPLWQPNVQAGQPMTLLGFPIRVSDLVPNTWTAGQYVGILGDFSYYWIVDALSMEIQVLTELYAETNQNGYICRAECDGMPVLESAFVRVKLASS